MEDTWVVFVVILILFVAIHFWKMRRFYVLVALNVPAIIFNSHNQIPDYDKIFKILKTVYNTPGRILFRNKKLVFITHPDDFRIILNNRDCWLKDEISYNHVAEFLGEGVFTCTNLLRWRKNRKLLSIVSNATTVNNETSIGVKVNAQLNKSDYMEWIHKLCAISFKKSFIPPYDFKCIFKLTPDGKEAKQLIQLVRNFNEKVVKIKRQQNTQSTNDVSKRKAFMDYYIEAGKPNDEQLRDEIATITFGGSDTSALTEGFLFMLLGMHPHIQDKVFEEQQAIFGDSDRSITPDDLIQMKYLEMVIKETLRLFPPAPIIGRTATQDIKLPSYVIPKGTSCYLMIYLLQRDPQFWENPLEFNPDRFLAEEMAKRHSYAWLPFSGGFRNCIGIKYGMVVMKVVVSSVVRKYQISCSCKKVEEIKIVPLGLLEAVDGQKISLELRNHLKCK